VATEADPVAGPDKGAATRAELDDGGVTRTVASEAGESVALSVGLSVGFGPADGAVVDDPDAEAAGGLASTGFGADFAISGIATFVGSAGPVLGSGAGETGGVFAGLGVGV
jgi:hypothetical protein